MIVPPTLGPLWGSETQPEPRSSPVYDCPAEILGETSGSTENLSLTSRVHDCPAYCWPSLGLGNTAEAEILGETSGEH